MALLRHHVIKMAAPWKNICFESRAPRPGKKTIPAPCPKIR